MTHLTFSNNLIKSLGWWKSRHKIGCKILKKFSILTEPTIIFHEIINIKSYNKKYIHTCQVEKKTLVFKRIETRWPLSLW
jgi:hypothetical protein